AHLLPAQPHPPRAPPPRGGVGRPTPCGVTRPPISGKRCSGRAPCPPLCFRERQRGGRSRTRSASLGWIGPGCCASHKQGSLAGREGLPEGTLSLRREEAQGLRPLSS